MMKSKMCRHESELKCEQSVVVYIYIQKCIEAKGKVVVV